tara:strand:+ start:2086 stop:2445 length:360 start_codon:yes stop_codon:yes gene_type:complete
MKRVFRKYTEWEDFKNGMFDEPPKDFEEMLNLSISLLRDCDRFFKVSLKVLSEWKVSSDVNLTNRSTNRRSWIGQAACCYEFGAPERLTRKAWASLSTIEKESANKVAEKIINIYEREN